MTEPWILIVEDNIDDANMIVRALAENKREEVPAICADASQALDLLNRSETLPKLVLLDGRLPGMESHVFLEMLRQTEGTRFLPVVLFSGHSYPKSVHIALTAGANSYVCKPLDFDGMLEHLGTTFHYWLDVHHHAQPVNWRVQK